MLVWCPRVRAWYSYTVYIGLAKTIYIRCIYGNFGREITKYMVIYGVYIRFWPTLGIYNTFIASPIGVWCFRVCEWHLYTIYKNTFHAKATCVWYFRVRVWRCHYYSQLIKFIAKLMFAC